MRKTISFAALIAVFMMICCMFCMSLTVSAAAQQEEPVVVTADIDKNVQPEQADANGTPDVLKVSKSSSGGKHNILLAIGVGFLVAVVGTAIFIFANISGYKNNGKTEPYPFSSKAPLELVVKDDVLINREVTSRKIETNNNK